MTEEKERIIMVMRVSDLPVPYVESRKVKCSSCQMECWVDVKFPSTLRPMCTHCLKGAAK